MKFLRYLFSYVPPDPLPEVPEQEPPDPSDGRELTDTYRTARRNLVFASAICIAWSSAQISFGNLSINLVGMSLDLSKAAVPLLLTLLLSYLTFQWGLEFAMMSRPIRRWRLARLDFRLVSRVARFALLALAAGVMQRSLATIGVLVVGLIALALTCGVLSMILTFVLMPLRMWARAKANRNSAANAVFEAAAWAGLFAVLLTVTGIVISSIAAYQYEPLRKLIWDTPPHPLAYGTFVATLLLVFLSQWFLAPLFAKLFAERPGYHTHRGEDGAVVYTFRNEPQDPLL